MNQAFIYSIISVFIVSLASVVMALPFLVKKKVSKRVQLFLLSLSVGALLSVVFFDFMPEIIEEGYTLTTGIFIIAGVLTFYLIERLIHFHHSGKYEKEGTAHSHAYHLGPINVIGDAIHNFLDGIVIASTYIVNPALGLSATMAVLFHELPQELADFGILLYSGYSRSKALLLNFASALAAIVGVLAVFLLSQGVEVIHRIVIPFAAGNFIYIASINLLPQLHRHCKLKETIEHLSAAALGVLVIYLITVYGGVHAH